MRSKRNEVRRNLREALHDDLATLRCLNSELRYAVEPRERAALMVSKQTAITRLRRTLAQLEVSEHGPQKSSKRRAQKAR
jgi:hypothetical protein